MDRSNNNRNSKCKDDASNGKDVKCGSMRCCCQLIETEPRAPAAKSSSSSCRKDGRGSGSAAQMGLCEFLQSLKAPERKRADSRARKDDCRRPSAAAAACNKEDDGRGPAASAPPVSVQRCGADQICVFLKSQPAPEWTTRRPDQPANGCGPGNSAAVAAVSVAGRGVGTAEVGVSTTGNCGASAGGLQQQQQPQIVINIGTMVSGGDADGRETPQARAGRGSTSCCEMPRRSPPPPQQQAECPRPRADDRAAPRSGSMSCCGTPKRTPSVGSGARASNRPPVGATASLQRRDQCADARRGGAGPPPERFERRRDAPQPSGGGGGGVKRGGGGGGGCPVEKRDDCLDSRLPQRNPCEKYAAAPKTEIRCVCRCHSDDGGSSS